MSTTTHCPTCGQVMPRSGRKRICCDCGVLIGKHGKWMICADGRVRHKDCVHPNGAWEAPSPGTPLHFEEGQDAICS